MDSMPTGQMPGQPGTMPPPSLTAVPPPNQPASAAATTVVQPALPKPPAPQPAKPHHIKPKLGKNFFGCAASIVIAAIAALSVVGLLIAKTGTVQLPVFSRFYTGPVPTRLINAEPMAPNAFKVLLSSRLFSQGIVKKVPPFTIKLNEREITGALFTAIDTALRDEKWKQVFTQIAIRPTDFEMLSQFQRGAVRLDVLIRFRPEMEKGGVMFVPVYAQVGDYPIPPSVAYNVLGYLFSRDLGTWSIKFGDMVLSGVKLHDAYLEAVVSSPAPTSAPAQLK